jgi:hypothetical protein
VHSAPRTRTRGGLDSSDEMASICCRRPHPGLVTSNGEVNPSTDGHGTSDGQNVRPEQGCSRIGEAAGHQRSMREAVSRLAPMGLGISTPARLPPSGTRSDAGITAGLDEFSEFLRDVVPDVDDQTLLTLARSLRRAFFAAVLDKHASADALRDELRALLAAVDPPAPTPPRTPRSRSSATPRRVAESRGPSWRSRPAVARRPACPARAAPSARPARRPRGRNARTGRAWFPVTARRCIRDSACARTARTTWATRRQEGEGAAPLPDAASGVSGGP